MDEDMKEIVFIIKFAPASKGRSILTLDSAVSGAVTSDDLLKVMFSAGRIRDQMFEVIHGAFLAAMANEERAAEPGALLH